MQCWVSAAQSILNQFWSHLSRVTSSTFAVSPIWFMVNSKQLYQLLSSYNSYIKAIFVKCWTNSCLIVSPLELLFFPAAQELTLLISSLINAPITWSNSLGGRPCLSVVPNSFHFLIIYLMVKYSKLCFFPII